MANELTANTAAPIGAGFGLPPGARQVLMLLALAGAVALGVTVAFWAQTPNFTLLYGNLSEKDSSGVLEGLTKANIQYKLDPASGAIMVPAKQVHEARLKLAGQGLPRGTGIGFEIMDDKPSFGNSQFQETARYQRAIEGELARSIMTMSNVQGARVHLAIPRGSAFIREREQPSASVLLNLYSGRSLESDQVAAVVHLVAASVPNLVPSRVTVIDQKGRLLTGSEADGNLTSTSNQLEYRHKLEESFVQRIEEILTPVTGAGAVKAQVTADIDFTITETARESYNPQGRQVRSEQTAEELNSGSAAAGGIPGALSNQPPGVATAPEQTAAAATPPPAAGGGQPALAALAELVKPAPPPTSSSKRATRNYELDKTVSHIRQQTGTVQRLSVAVVVDDVVVTDRRGRVKRTARTPEELARLTAIVKEAIGFDEKRGDTVNVTNAAFSTPSPAAPIAESPLWKQEWLWDLAKQAGGGLLILVLLMMVVRPLLRGLQARSVPVYGGMANDRLSLGGPTAAQLAASGGHEAQMTAARTAAQQDPKRVAQVVKGWVASDG